MLHNDILKVQNYIINIAQLHVTKPFTSLSVSKFSIS